MIVLWNVKGKLVITDRMSLDVAGPNPFYVGPIHKIDPELEITKGILDGVSIYAVSVITTEECKCKGKCFCMTGQGSELLRIIAKNEEGIKRACADVDTERRKYKYKILEMSTPAKLDESYIDIEKGMQL